MISRMAVLPSFGYESIGRLDLAICNMNACELTFAYYAGDFIIIFNIADVFFYEDGASSSL